jgi:hypothetical protein
MTINDYLRDWELRAWQTGAIFTFLAGLWLSLCFICTYDVSQLAIRLGDIRRHPLGFNRAFELEPIEDQAPWTRRGLSPAMEEAFPAKKQRRPRTPADDWELYDRPQ